MSSHELIIAPSSVFLGPPFILHSILRATTALQLLHSSFLHKEFSVSTLQSGKKEKVSFHLCAQVFVALGAVVFRREALKFVAVTKVKPRAGTTFLQRYKHFRKMFGQRA